MIEKGIDFTFSEKVTTEKTAESMGSGDLAVYATPAMIALMEGTAAKSVRPMLEEGQTTVGTKLNIEHLSATPVGCEVTCTSVLTDVDRRRLVFNVVVNDEKGVIGKGVHERFIVDSMSFMAKTNTKKEK